MQLNVHARYRTQAVSYAPGQVIDVTEAEAAHLMVDSPGTFSVAGAPAREVPAEPDLGAMSTDTATGLTAPDRRQRGGLRR